MSSRKYGIDLGTNTIKIYQKNQGIVLDEYNAIAISKGKVLAIGNEAYEMFERNPDGIKIIFPVQNGVIADVANMVLLMNSFMKKVAGVKKFGTSDFLVATPTDITEVERRAFFELIANSKLKAGNIKVIEKPIVDALGIDLDITTARGVMVVNIGADTTEVSILSLGGIVISKLIPIGGNKFDESIKNIIKKNYNLYIGDKTAEFIKKELANAVPLEETFVEVFGRHVVSGLPAQINVSSNDVCDAIVEHLFSIIDAMKAILERTPPEISSDIIDGGIYMTGGSSNIKNLDLLIQKETDLKVNIANDATNSVVKGLGSVFEKQEYYDLCSELKQITLNI